MKRTRVSTSRWRNAFLRRHQADAGVDAVIAARQQPQALRRLVEQLGLGQDAAADRHHGVGGQDVGAAQLVVELAPLASAASALARASRLAQARGSSPRFGVSSISAGLQRIGLDADLVDQGEPARRAGGEHEFGTADHDALPRKCDSAEWASKLAESPAFHN